MKIKNLIRVLESIEKLRGNMELYDITEYRGKTYLDFKCDFQPYELTYYVDEVKGCYDESGKKSFMLANEIYVDGNEKPVTNSFCIEESGDILTAS